MLLLSRAVTNSVQVTLRPGELGDQGPRAKALRVQLGAVTKHAAKDNRSYVRGSVAQKSAAALIVAVTGSPLTMRRS